MSGRKPSTVFGWLEGACFKVYDHLILPFLESYDPLPKVALGAGIGVFVSFTPTVGLQMYLVTMIWIVSRLIFRYRFNITIGMALVWISNPITVVPMYYLFLKTGQLIQMAAGNEIYLVSYSVFQQEIQKLGAGVELSWGRYLIYATQVLLENYGWPMVLGSLIYAIPLGLLTYPVTIFSLGRYRRRLARSEGISYPEWREKYEAKT